MGSLAAQYAAMKHGGAADIEACPVVGSRRCAGLEPGQRNQRYSLPSQTKTEPASSPATG